MPILDNELKRLRVTTYSIQIDSNTIDGNVELVHSQYKLYSNVTSVHLVFVSDKIINNSDNFEKKFLSF